MKKRVFGRKLSRDRDSRLSLFRGLIKSLALNGSITTTKAKAKAIQPDIDKIMSDLKVDTVATRRRILAKLANDGDSVTKLGEFSNSSDRQSGFTRIVNLPRRRGDNAEMAVISIIDQPKKKETKNEKDNPTKKEGR